MTIEGFSSSSFRNIPCAKCQKLQWNFICAECFEDTIQSVIIEDIISEMPDVICTGKWVPLTPQVPALGVKDTKTGANATAYFFEKSVSPTKKAIVCFAEGLPNRPGDIDLTNKLVKEFRQNEIEAYNEKDCPVWESWSELPRFPFLYAEDVHIKGHPLLVQFKKGEIK